jgi:hypothetical protein
MTSTRPEVDSLDHERTQLAEADPLRRCTALLDCTSDEFVTVQAVVLVSTVAVGAHLGAGRPESFCTACWSMSGKLLGSIAAGDVIDDMALLLLPTIARALECPWPICW